ncbi:HET-domain-containing protein [Xylariaceae sp. AK1471]|nr:HET-domain-containing protein [Xylariaceae sp. AK1471]
MNVMDSFDGTNQELCFRCRSINIAAYFSDQDYPGTVELGPYQDILSSGEQCLFCRLMIRALSFNATEYWKPGEYPVEICYLGRREEESSSPALHVWFDSTSQTLPKGISGHHTTQAQLVPLHSTSINPSLSYASRQHGRFVGAKIDFALVRTWINNCIDDHGSQCSPKEVTSRNEFELLVIDVEHMRLVKMTSCSRYVALSYVWGKTKTLSTTKDNLAALQEEGAIERHRNHLPRVISDAINLVRGIGEKFLWVDALCIIQDDNNYKNEYIPRMDRIFGQALLTIVALTTSPGPDTGLPGVVAGSRPMLQIVADLGSLQLVNRLPSISSVQQRTVWGKRGWTFQEAILAHRKLYVSEHQVYWQCDRVSRSEDHVQGHEHRSAFEGVTDDLETQFRLYASLVLKYSSRELTYHSDSLNAFAGILSKMTVIFGWTFASALPENILPFALLWVPQASIERRPIDCLSPSWCWSAWSGNIYWDWWRQWSYADKNVSLQTEVESFTIKDSHGLRTITCKQGSGFIPSTTENQKSDSHWAARFDAGAAFPQATLFFEANTLGLEAYALLKPKPVSVSHEAKCLPAFIKNSLYCNMWIYDKAGCHCGTLYGLTESWTKEHNRFQCELVLLARSDQDKVTDGDIEASKNHLPLEYMSSRQYYEEVFDTSSYGYRRSWALNVMLIEWKESFAERIAVGQMHADAWDTALQKSKRIIST